MIGAKEIKAHALARAELDVHLAEYEAALISQDPQRIKAAQLACSVGLERLLDAKIGVVRVLLSELG